MGQWFCHKPKILDLVCCCWKKNLIYLSYCTSLFQPGLSSNCFECKDFWPLCWNQASCPSSLISLWRVLSHHPLLIRFITTPKAPGFDIEQLGLIYWHCLSISSLNFNPGFPKSHDCGGDYSEHMEETPLNNLLWDNYGGRIEGQKVDRIAPKIGRLRASDYHFAEAIL